MSSDHLNKAVILLATSLLLFACDRSESPGSETAIDEQQFEETDKLDYLSDEQKAAYAMAIDALGDMLGQEDLKEIELLAIRATEWSDSSLGCPQPGVEYLQVMTPGYVLRLGVKGRSYVVNVGNSTAAVCNQPGAGVLQRKPSAIKGDKMVALREQAKMDLADRLGIDQQAIQASMMIPGTWTNSSLGCPEPGVEYKDEPVTGFRFVLSYQGRAFNYNTDGERVIACPPVEID